MFRGITQTGRIDTGVRLKRQRAYTLVELLVVVAIISLWGSILPGLIPKESPQDSLNQAAGLPADQQVVTYRWR